MMRLSQAAARSAFIALGLTLSGCASVLSMVGLGDPPPKPDPTNDRARFEAPGALVAGSGQGLSEQAVFVPEMRFPLEEGPAFANSQVYGIGGLHAPRPGGQCDSSNYSFPWRDNFCETRSAKTRGCPAGRGHQGQDLRPATCEKDKHWAVATEAGTIVHLGRYTVTLASDSGVEYRYMHLNMDRLAVEPGSRVTAGQRIGLISNHFGGTPTTIHLHFEIRQVIRNADGRLEKRFVPPYPSLVRAYLKLIGEGDDLAEL